MLKYHKRNAIVGLTVISVDVTSSLDTVRTRSKNVWQKIGHIRQLSDSSVVSLAKNFSAQSVGQMVSGLFLYLILAYGGSVGLLASQLVSQLVS